MVDFFIRRPVFATVCALLIILAGAVCIPTLPISLYPTLAPPWLQVTSNYVGANSQTVESAVTIPLEQQINGVQGMHYISSTSSNDGTSYHYNHVSNWLQPRYRRGRRTESRLGRDRPVAAGGE